MRTARLALCGALLALLGGAARAAEAETDVLFTKQQEFRIPFQLEPPESPEQAPVEVQLYVSDTQGREQWPLVDRQAPEGNGFTFVAPRDGEYWFVVRTLDRQGKLLPEVEGPTEAELKVVVDATWPKLDVEGLVGESGEIMIRWQGGDSHVAADRPQVEYRSARQADSPWRLVAVNEGLNGVAILPPSPEPIVVRAQLGDLAGNVTVVEMLVDPASKAAAQGVVVQGPGAAAPAAPRADVAAVPSNRSPRAASGAPVGGYPVAGAPADAPNYIGPVAGPAATAPIATAVAANLGSAAPNANPANRPPVYRNETAGGEAPQFQTVDKAGKSQEFARGGNFIRRDGLPSGVRADVVNSPRFLLEYDINAVGASGVSRVELYGTTDGGESWKLVGADLDKTSPMEVNVDKDGVYGFSFVVSSGAGVAAKKPERGGAPQKWVMVDTQKPKAELKAIEQGPDGEYVIRWEADDRQLASKPIALTFSYAPNGPWYPIAAGVENEGSYRWAAGKRAPKQLFVRMTVRDLAGNATVVDSSRVTVADRLQPQIQVRQARVPGSATILR